MPALTDERRDQIRQAQALVRGGQLNSRQQLDAEVLLQDIIYQACEEDPWYFLTEIATTLDEQNIAAPYRPMPRLGYLHHLVRIFEANLVNFIPKSRQLRLTWLMVGLHLHQAMFKEAQLVLFQNKKEEDAGMSLRRMHGMYERLPGWMKEKRPAELTFCKLEFKQHNSLVLGIPQGEHQIRMHTPSAVFSDEMAFQDQAEAGYGAAMPAVGSRGRFTGVSSCAPGFFAEVFLMPAVPGTEKNLGSGLRTWKNGMGVQVTRVHYTVDPERDEQWVARESVKYPGGRTGPQWRQEQECDPYAFSGERVYPHFNEATHVYQACELPDFWPCFRTIDVGYHNPTACLWAKIDPDGVFHVFKEHYQAMWSIEQNASAIKGLTGKQKIEYTVIDPSAFAKTSAGPKSIGEQYAEHGIFCVPGDNDVDGGISAIANLMIVTGDGKPKLRFSNACPNAIREHREYRYKEQDASNATQQVLEKPVKREDHTCDALRYLVMLAPENYCKLHRMREPMQSGGMPTNITQHILAKARVKEDWYDGE